MNPSPSSLEDPAVTVVFNVVVDAINLGTFISCTGLGVSVETEKRVEGGFNGFVHVLPTNASFSNVVLTRPVTKDTAAVAAWVTSMVNSTSVATAGIQAMRADGTVLVEFSLQGVIPVKWTGPQLSTDSPKIATETLELAHHGFRAEGKG